MRDVFDLDAEIIADPVSGEPFVVPVARAKKPTGYGQKR
jgi:hypothetical protein